MTTTNDSKREALEEVRAIVRVMHKKAEDAYAGVAHPRHGGSDGDMEYGAKRAYDNVLMEIDRLLWELDR